MATVVELLHLYYDTMISVLNMTEVVKLQLYPFIDIGEFFHLQVLGLAALLNARRDLVRRRWRSADRGPCAPFVSRPCCGTVRYHGFCIGVGCLFLSA